MVLKKIVFIFLTLGILVSAHAQRRYNHVPRVKVDITVPTVQTDKSESYPIEIEEVDLTLQLLKNESTIPQKTIAFIPPTFVKDEVKPNVQHVFKNQEIKKNKENKPIFINKVLKEHKKLSNVKETDKTMLRTWKWLLIVTCILLAIGVVLLIIGYSPPVSALLYVLGYCLGSIGFVGAIIVLILGLSGRI